MGLPKDATVLGDVRLAETLDAVYITPIKGTDGTALLRLIKGAAGASSTLITRSASGVRVPEAAATSVGWDQVAGRLSWSPDARRFVDNRCRLASDFERVLTELRGIKDGGKPYAESLIRDSAGLITMDDHQIVNVAAMTIAGSPGLCVFDEQGAGKTVTFIFAFDLLVARDEADQAIIVAPKSMVGEWPKDIARFRGDLYKPTLLTGSTKQKRSVLTCGADIFITNFETTVSMEAELKSLMRARPGRTVLVVDESFFIKSIDAKRTRALRRLREWAGKTYVLCGTPAPNAASDLVQQVSLVDFGLAFSGVELPQDREAAIPIVQRAIEQRALFTRHLKADVLPHLPAKRFQRVFVPMEAEQKRIYQRTLGDLVSELEGLDEVSFAQKVASFLARRSALLQICSSPSAVAHDYDKTPAKLSALDSLLETLVEKEGEKVVIWSFYTASVTAIFQRYSRYGAVRYDGAVTSVDDRREAVRRFQEDEETRLFIGNPAAAGAGLTLHRARVAVYESLSNQAAHYLQSLDRIHRRGQNRPVDYVVMLCDGSIEVQEYERLITKETAAQNLLGDRATPPVTRDSFLAEMKDAGALLNEGNGR
jgi:SNF2 family DNA or RNA helicase